MSEWNVIHENFHTKHSVLTAPDEHMPYIIQLHIMSIRWTYYEQMKQQNIWSVHMTSIIMSKWSSRTSDQFIWLVSIGEENRNSQCFSYKGRRGGGGRGGETSTGVGGGGGGRQSKEGTQNVLL